MKTRIHAYCFNVSDPEQARQYEELAGRLKAAGLRCMRSWSHRSGHYRFILDRGLDGEEIELETAHLFADQWNTAPVADSETGLRVHDWAEDSSHRGNLFGSMAPENIRRGHYLDQTDDMRRVRSETLKCGFCGKQEPADGIDLSRAFCPHCRGSEYLKESELYLTRFIPVASDRGRNPRPQLTEAEAAYLVPLYKDAQREGMATRAGRKLVDFRARVLADFEKATRYATRRRDGFTWLLDHDLGGLAADNVLFYDHTGRFGFGWRTPIADDIAAEIMGKLSDEGFPFPYDVATVGRGKLTGCVED